MGIGERKRKVSEFEELCKEYSEEYVKYINLKRELKENSRKIEDIQSKVHLNDNIKNLLESKQDDLERKKELKSKIEKQLKKENKIAILRWSITGIFCFLCYLLGIFDMISSTNLFRIGLFLFVFCLASFTAYIFGKTILKNYPKLCLGIMIVVFVIACWKIIDWYGLSGTAIPIQGTTLENISNLGVCAVGVSLFVFLWEVVVLVIKNNNNENIEEQRKWEYSKEKESKIIDEIEQIEQEIDIITKNIEVEKLEELLKKRWNSLPNKEETTPEEVEEKLVDSLYMVDWGYELELPPPMTHIEKASKPMAFLYRWDDNSQELELLDNFILNMTRTITLFNCSDLMEIKVVDFILNNNTTRNRNLEKWAEVVESDKVENVFSELFKYKQGEDGTIIEHNQKKLQNTSLKEYKKYKIIEFIVPAEGMPQYQDFWQKEWWKDLTSAEKYGYLPIFYIDQEAFENEKTEFMTNFKKYMKNYSIYEIKDDMYCEKRRV